MSNLIHLFGIHHIAIIVSSKGAVGMNRSPSSRQLKKYKFFLPVEIYLLAVLCSLQVNFVFFHWC